jgi:NAD(P)-dependent dehydrogenase (short-subunit alcohol dehydrogenase family)
MQGRPALQFKPRPAETIAKAAVEGLDVFLVAGDFSKSADVIRVVDETARHFGRLDGLINNAGGMLGRVPYAEMTDEQYDKVMDLNARSVVTACRAALPWLKKQGGFIVNDGRPASAQWRRRRRRHLRLGEVLCLEHHARHGQGMGRRQNQGQRGRARLHRHAVPRPLFAAPARHGDAVADPDGPRRHAGENASAPICSCHRMR